MTTRSGAGYNEANAMATRRGAGHNEENATAARSGTGHNGARAVAATAMPSRITNAVRETFETNKKLPSNRGFTSLTKRAQRGAHRPTSPQSQQQKNNSVTTHSGSVRRSREKCPPTLSPFPDMCPKYNASIWRHKLIFYRRRAFLRQIAQHCVFCLFCPPAAAILPCNVRGIPVRTHPITRPLIRGLDIASGP